MKKQIQLMIFVVISSLSASLFAWPVPMPYNSVITVDNQSGKLLPDRIYSVRYGTIMKKAPNPIGLGEARFENDGNTYYPPGFSMDIGDQNNPAGMCKMSFDIISGVVVQQAGNGSSGFVCSNNGKMGLVLRKV